MAAALSNPRPSNLFESCAVGEMRDFGTRQQPYPTGDPLEGRTEESKI